MRPGEIYLAQFPFGDVPGMKLRPVLLLTEPLVLNPGGFGRLYLLGYSRSSSSHGRGFRP
jgi:hypothetical protein